MDEGRLLDDSQNLPPDNHVHSEWSWDAAAGAMEATCARAVRIGLPSLSFTEHADFTNWTYGIDADIPDHWARHLEQGLLLPPRLDVEGYLACLERCRDTFPGLSIRTGVELGEPHWHAAQASSLLDSAPFERVLASVHSAPIDGGGFGEVGSFFDDRGTEGVIREYLREVTRLIEGFDQFAVLAHIDYPVRYWPKGAKPFAAMDFEDEYRGALRALAARGKVLEVNTRVPLDRVIITWWREEGGTAISFASDAHKPDALAAGLREAAGWGRAAGFRPSSDPTDFWVRD